MSTARLRQHLAALQRVADAHGGTRVAGGPGYAASVATSVISSPRPVPAKVSTYPFTSYRERRESGASSRRETHDPRRGDRLLALDAHGGLRGESRRRQRREPGDFAARATIASPAEASASSSRRRSMQQPPARRAARLQSRAGRSTPRSAIRTPRRYRGRRRGADRPLAAPSERRDVSLESRPRSDARPRRT